jgi:hypothetical protein
MSYFDLHASAIQAVAAVATLLLTVGLVGITWRYVQLTRELVEQNREITEMESAREIVRRRRKAISLRRAALVLTGHLEGARDLLPNALQTADWDWRTEIDEVKRLALDVGWGSDRIALDAGECLERWYAAGADAQGSGGPQRGAARAAIEDAIAALNELADQATHFTDEEL